MKWKQPPATRQEESETFARDAQAALEAAESGETPAPSSRDSLYRHGVTLAELQPGECGTVRRFLSTKQGRLRLLEMGLTPGTHVKVIRVAAFGGPLDILVRGYQLSLRRDEAAAVWLDDEE
jgi:Fe2+ transport system protein FeoA